MPFQYLLTNLLVDVPGSCGAIFVDPEGEAVEYVARRATPYELKLEGAYNGIFMRRAAQLAHLVGAGELRWLAISGNKVRVMGKALRAGYSLVLILDAGAPISLADVAMTRTGEILNREIP